jgi:hypothetical protein
MAWSGHSTRRPLRIPGEGGISPPIIRAEGGLGSAWKNGENCSQIWENCQVRGLSFVADCIDRNRQKFKRHEERRERVHKMMNAGLWFGKESVGSPVGMWD